MQMTIIKPFTSLLLFLFTQTLLQSQPLPSTQIADFEGGTLPIGWSFEGSPPRINTNLGKTNNYSVEILTANSHIASNYITDPSIITFWTRIPQYNDRFEIQIEMSSDRITWEVLKVIPHEFDKNKFSEDFMNLFISHNVSVNREGNFFFRWGLKNYQSGSFIFDEFSFSQIPKTKKEQNITQKDMEEIKTMINDNTRRLVQIDYQQTEKNFKNAAESYNKNLNLLTNLIDKTRTLFITSETANKLAVRNQMTNPMNYESFDKIVRDVNAYLPEIKKNHLTDILSLVKKPLQMADRVLLGGALSTFANMFKSLVADAFSPSNLREKINSRNERKEIEIKGINLYNRTKNFLTVILNENDKVNRLNALVGSSATETDKLLRDLEAFLPRYLQAIDIQEKDLLKKADLLDRDALEQIKNSSIQFYSSALGPQTHFMDNKKQLSNHQKEVLNNTTKFITKIEDFKERYDNIALSVLSFYQEFKSDVNSPNPLQQKVDGKINYLVDQKTALHWEWQQNSIKSNFDNLIENFKKSYILPNLYR